MRGKSRTVQSTPPICYQNLIVETYRSFIAASRRKDRSLAVRLRSAHKASCLHKRRTGKNIRISREIVEAEAIYEEVDERYQEILIEASLC